MTLVTALVNYDAAVESQALRKAGMLGRGGNANSLFAIDIDQLPGEARVTLDRIIAGGPFPYPHHDGKWFQNRFGDLPSGQYLEFTVPTPGAGNRGRRRVVGRKSNGMAFFTACHYDRVQVSGGSGPAERSAAQRLETAAVDGDYRNGFYLITGMNPDYYRRLADAIKATQGFN